MASYKEAVTALNTLQSNAATIARAVAERDKRRHLSVPETALQAAFAGVKLDAVDRLSVIHVAGTKGKGSTCAFCESILRAHGYKTGFFSSPHLVEVRERIRINGQPLSKDAFNKYFWDCFRPLEEAKDDHTGTMPPYFRFLTIMAFHAFIQEKVDVAIIEVGVGGQFDCTNILRTPVVCGVSSLDMDHTNILGDTIQKIALQKGGIFKPGVPAVTVPQPENSEDVLKEKAQEVGCPLELAPPLEEYTWPAAASRGLGIPGFMQEQNASLALQLARRWLDDHAKPFPERSSQYSKYKAGESESPEHYFQPARPFAITELMAKGLEQCRWPGRNQKLVGERVTYYIDGAHTPRSVEPCARWFQTTAREDAQSVKGPVARVLLFNTTGDRKPESLLEYLVACDFDAAVFCPNLATKSGNEADQMNLTVTADMQQGKCVQNRNSWLELLSHQPPPPPQEIVPSKRSKGGDAASPRQPDAAPVALTFPCVQDALAWIAQGRDPRLPASDLCAEAVPPRLRDAAQVQVLCTGSLHLMGTILGLLDPDLTHSMSL